MVFEWLYFAHQMLITIGIRGSPAGGPERLRDYWGTDGSPRSRPVAPRSCARPPPGDAALGALGLRRRRRRIVPLWRNGSRRGSGSRPSRSLPSPQQPRAGRPERESAAYDVERLMATAAG